MVKEKKEKEVPKAFGIDFGIGGLFKGISKLIDLAADLSAKGGEAGGEISSEGGPASGWKKEGEIDLSHLKEGMKAVFGFSVKTAVGGKPVVEPFGNVKKTPQGPKVEEEREPITDVFNEKDEIVVVAEMPGVSEEGIFLDFPATAGSRQEREKGEDILVIKSVGKDRKYHKEVLLPAKVKAETLTSNYKNGVLEIKIKKIS